MKTYTSNPPWKHSPGPASFEPDGLSADFKLVHDRLATLVRATAFTLSQFRDTPDKDRALSRLMWRHYIVYWSAAYASKFTDSVTKNLVECGVCDGLTIFFAMSAMETVKADYTAYLYDAWSAMRDDLLTEDETKYSGLYDYLELENTQKNLSQFRDRAVYNQGYIPEVFENARNPDELVWMHLDLNSSIPTVACLGRFFRHLLPGGLILFDDYAWLGHVETKRAVDDFFRDKSGQLLPIPTGQAIFFKQ